MPSSYVLLLCLDSPSSLFTTSVFSLSLLTHINLSSIHHLCSACPFFSSTFHPLSFHKQVPNPVLFLLLCPPLLPFTVWSNLSGTSLYKSSLLSSYILHHPWSLLHPYLFPTFSTPFSFLILPFHLLLYSCPLLPAIHSLSHCPLSTVFLSAYNFSYPLFLLIITIYFASTLLFLIPHLSYLQLSFPLSSFPLHIPVSHSLTTLPFILEVHIFTSHFQSTSLAMLFMSCLKCLPLFGNLLCLGKHA